MTDEPIQIRRYPNRRFYARHTSKYVSLKEIEKIVQAGQTVEIRDSQSGDDLTRAVLTRIIMDHQPEKMSLFPIGMLHSILRSNDTTTNFLRDYFRHSLTYLDYLQRHSAAAKTMAGPMHWVKAWLDGIVPEPPTAAESEGEDVEAEDSAPQEGVIEDDAAALARRIEHLEARIHQLEAEQDASRA